MTSDPAPPPRDDDPLGLEALWRLVEATPGELAVDPLIGMSLGGVEIVRMIAEGGMGRVYEGLQDSPRRTVAVKVLRPGPNARAAIRRFLQEAQILGQLRHPWICQVFSAGTFEIAGTHLPYFVMEHIPGSLPITEYVRDRDLSRSERLALFGQVCDAVAHAHASGVVHRDLKPGNVLVDAKGHPKVIDFGIARGDATAADLAALTMTATGAMLGTIQYMSPEQVDAESPVNDARADVYALGVILHEVLAGKPPYDLDGVPLLEAVRIIRDIRPDVLRGSTARADRIAMVTERCLEKSPARRYANAGELATDLRRIEEVGLRLVDRARLTLRAFGGRRRWSIATAATAALSLAVLVSLGNRVRRLQAFDLLLPGWRGVAMQGVPSRTAATLPFRYGFTSVLDDDADRYLVEAVNVIKWNDPREELRVNYWGPKANNIEGVLVFRFLLPGRAARIHLRAASSCWDFQKHPGGFGRGASALEASRDGISWISLRDHISHRDWGAGWTLDEDLPPDLLGTSECWLRIRLLTELTEARMAYTVAQFCRAVPAEGREVFSIEADCAPASVEK